MKKSFTLMEVIVAVSLISVVVLSLFKIKEDNIYLVKKYSDIMSKMNYILLSISPDNLTNSDKTVDLSRTINFKDENSDAYLKNKKVETFERVFNTRDIDVLENFSLKLIEYKKEYLYEETFSKKIYRFTLEI